MHRPWSLLVGLILLASCERPGEGTADRALAAQALKDVLAFPSSAVVSVSAGADAAQAAFTTPAPLETVAEWYRVNLKLNDWVVQGDQAMPDGSLAIYAERRGKPLWITLRRNSGGPGTTDTPLGPVPPPHRHGGPRTGLRLCPK